MRYFTTSEPRLCCGSFVLRSGLVTEVPDKDASIEKLEAHESVQEVEAHCEDCDGSLFENLESAELIALADHLEIKIGNTKNADKLRAKIADALDEFEIATAERTADEIVAAFNAIDDDPEDDDEGDDDGEDDPEDDEDDEDEE